VNTLLVMTQLAGIVLLIATMVLLFFRRIYLDAETKQPIKFTLPLIGEINTQAPVLVLVLIGASMVVYPLSKMGADKVVVQGEIDTGGKSVTVLVVADPDYVHSQDASGKFSIKIPLLATDATYRIKYVVDKLIIADQIATPKNGHIELSLVQWAAPVEDSGMSKIPVKKEVSDEELRRLSIAN
jgi:hypothetical protein